MHRRHVMSGSASAAMRAAGLPSSSPRSEPEGIGVGHPVRLRLSERRHRAASRRTRRTRRTAPAARPGSSGSRARSRAGRSTPIARSRRGGSSSSRTRVAARLAQRQQERRDAGVVAERARSCRHAPAARASPPSARPSRAPPRPCRGRCRSRRDTPRRRTLARHSWPTLCSPRAPISVARGVADVRVVLPDDGLGVAGRGTRAASCSVSNMCWSRRFHDSREP